MTRLLLNIWNRNIRYNWEFIEKSYDKKNKNNENFYEMTKLIFENIENEKDNIKIEIIPPILNKYKIDEIYIFATNQNPYFEQDTFYEAKIIEYLLKDKYKIKIIQYKNDPRIRDEVFRFFEDFFISFNKDREKTYILWSWWVPAMKEALNFYSVINIENSVIVDVDEKTNSVFISKIQNEYLKNFDKKIFYNLIKEHNYSWAYIFLKNSRLNNIELENYCLYLSERYNFNFSKANNLLNNFKTDFIKKINNYNLEDEKNIENRKKVFKEMIIELLDNLEITFDKWEYISFLWKTFSLQENIIKYIFENYYNLSLEHNIEEIENKFNIKAKKTKKWKKFFEIESILKEIENIDNENIKEFLIFNKQLKKLKDLRNKSIIAHSFWWIKREELINTYNLIKNFKKNYWWIKENIFKKAEEEILKLFAF